MTGPASVPQPRALRTLAEIYAAGLADGSDDPPLTQDQADYCYALLAPYLPVGDSPGGPGED